MLIWLEDKGPGSAASSAAVGWVGHSLCISCAQCASRLIRLGRWTQSAISASPRWAIAARLRLNELPQLLNVLNGEMSLIGPRPERPELEHDLEKHIPHYRKRHWMRPGLSGWAQVCVHYASSIEDSELKLSYDLYYLRNFSTWLDFVILLRTIKTVLKAGGR